jgi:hypothetical protein
MNQSNYFDLVNIWMNELIGSALLFFFVGIVIIFFIGLKSRMSWEMSLILSVLWTGICFSIGYAIYEIFWTLAIILVAVLFYYNISKAFKRG